VGWWQEGHPAVKPSATAMITTSHIGEVIEGLTVQALKKGRYKLFD